MVKPLPGELVPRIWADIIFANLKRRAIIGSQQWQEEQAAHEQRMAIDPEYARAYEQRQAEDETESYWDALYDNQRLEDEEEDWDY